MVKRFAASLLCSLSLAGCTGASTPAPAAKARPASNDARVKAFADNFLSAYFDRNPEAATYYGVPGRKHDALTDNSLAATQAWAAKEDTWLGELKSIDPSTIEAEPLRATYAIVRQALEGDVAKRVCRDELWPISQMTGWQINYGYLITVQPVDTEVARKEALVRWAALPKYIDTEIANLGEGIKAGYTAPKLNVRIVMEQVRTLATSPLKDSPFGSPVQRDTDAAFKKEFGALVTTQINPAMKRYADYLEKEYLPKAREVFAVSANPNGAACYDASVLYHSSSPKTAKEVHELGLREIDNLTTQMKEIAQRLFKNDDVPAALRKLSHDKQYKFKDRAEKIAYSQAALQRAKDKMHDWFGLLPRADVEIKPYPAFREKNAPNEYNSAAEDGSRPAVFLISAYQAEKQSRVEDESTAFHETIPGHHLQGAIALERKEIHPIGRYLFNSGYAEGWALYAETVADEMKLFSGDVDRMGLMSSQALRAARLVVDSGLHTMSWTRQQAIDYMLQHTAEDEHAVSSEVDRYIIYPGQATAYMIGKVEIRAARDEAQKAMGDRFDIKAFHDRVLEDGGVPLTFLREKIRAWENGGGK
ncbi:MAG: DUF885 domain-containing protein [Vicinamibacteria bacterium]